MMQRLSLLVILCNVYIQVAGNACPSGKFQCNNLQCIDNSLVCDSSFDCSDNTDETSCPTSTSCPEGTHRCYSTGPCVSTACGTTEASPGIDVDSDTGKKLSWWIILLSVVAAVSIVLGPFLVYWFYFRKDTITIQPTTADPEANYITEKRPIDVTNYAPEATTLEMRT